MRFATLPKTLRRRVGRHIDRHSTLGRPIWNLRLYGPFGIGRVRPFLTRLLGPAFVRSRQRIEIDITYACNLACANCNRSVSQAPSSSALTAAQIAAFVEESIRAGTKWQRIRLLGGEPTLHPQFFEILAILRRYRDHHSPRTRLEVSTNGFGPRVAEALAKLPPDIHVNNSSKDSSGAEQARFTSFNVAPRDLPAYDAVDFANGCSVLKLCGMGLGPSGYYPCAVAAGIDRVLGLDLGRATLPAAGDDMVDELRTFCSWCGLFKRRLDAPLEGPRMSPSWEEAYARFREKRPVLREYQGRPDEAAARDNTRLRDVEAATAQSQDRFSAATPISQYVADFRKTPSPTLLLRAAWGVVSQRRTFEVAHGIADLLVRRPGRIDPSSLKGGLPSSLSRAAVRVANGSDPLTWRAGFPLIDRWLSDIAIREHGACAVGEFTIVGEYGKRAARLFLLSNEGVATDDYYMRCCPGVRHIHCVYPLDDRRFIVATGDSSRFLDRWIIERGRMRFEKRLMRYLGGFTAAARVRDNVYLGTDFSGRPNYLMRLSDRRRFYLPAAAFRQWVVRMEAVADRYILVLSKELDVLGGMRTISLFDACSGCFVATRASRRPHETSPRTGRPIMLSA